MRLITNDELGRLLGECAGEPEAVDWGEGTMDTLFADMGYDSIALLELASRIEQEHGVHVSEEAIADLDTPRAFLTYINRASATHR